MYFYALVRAVLVPGNRCGLWQTRSMKKQLKTAAAMLSAVALLSACGEAAVEKVVVSEKPEPTVVENDYIQQPSQLGVRLRVEYDDLVRIIETSIPGEQEDTGKKRVCKKVLGFKACSTVLWDYRLRRTGAVSVSAQDQQNDSVRIAFPFEFEGTAGIRGELAKALGLSTVDFDGAVDIATVSKLDIAGDWCPKIQATVDYKWSREPRVEWAGGLDFNVRKLLDSELEKQLKDIDRHLASAIDCEQIRNEVMANWQPRSLPLDLDLALVGVDDAETLSAEQAGTKDNSIVTTTAEAVEQMYLNVTPLAAAFSGVKTESDALGFTLQLDSLLSIDSTAVRPPPDDASLVVNQAKPGEAAESGVQITTPENSGVLPTLQSIPYETGDTRFSLLVRAPYAMLAKLSLAALADKPFQSQTAAGDVAVKIRDVSVFPAGSRLGIGLKFDADMPASRQPLAGEVFMTAQPIIDASGTVLRFENFEVTKLLDSVLWNSLASLFKERIVQSLEQKAQIDLGNRFAELEIDLLGQLANPERTHGARIDAKDLRVRLQDMFTETKSLALVLEATTKLEVELPFTVFERTQGQ